jgi:hypothetical protein
MELSCIRGSLFLSALFRTLQSLWMTRTCINIPGEIVRRYHGAQRASTAGNTISRDPIPLTTQTMTVETIDRTPADYTDGSTSIRAWKIDPEDSTIKDTDEDSDTDHYRFRPWQPEQDPSFCTCCGSYFKRDAQFYRRGQLWPIRSLKVGAEHGC